MKYFFRILAFLFIGFTSLYCSTLEEALEAANQKIASAIASAKESILFSNLGCSSKGCFIKIDNTVYSVPSQTDKCISQTNSHSGDHYVCYSDKYEEIHYVKNYYTLYDRAKSFEALTTIDPTICDYYPSDLKCEIVGTAPAYKTSFIASPVCSLKEGEYFSAIIGKCIPKQECPVGQYAKMDYNDNGEYIGQSCTSNCFELLNRRDRFDCTCNLFGKGNYVSSKIDSVLEISNGGPSGDFYSGEVQCENGSFTNKDISDYISDSRDDNSPISKDKLKSLASTFMGANDHHTRNYTSGSSDGSSDADKGSKNPLTAEEQKQDKDKVKIDEPASQQNPSESIKYDEKTNTVTTTDSAGNTQAVTPSNVTKDDKGELQSIEYTDPETGKTIEYKTKDDGTWERVEHQGQGTNPNENDSGTGQGEGKPGGSSDGEGAGTSDNGKKDGEDDGDGKFVGGEFGALGNANDFDEGGLLSGLNDELDTLTDDNLGLLDNIVNNVTSYIDDLKGSLDNVSKKASALSKNPFSSSNVTNCPINFSLLDQNIKIDFCQYTSQFKNLFYAIFYLVLNVYIAFGIFKLFVLILISI